MAFIKEFTDNTGTIHTNSYWYPTRISIDYRNYDCRIVYEGFKDLEASSNNRDSLLGGKYDYIFCGNKFLELCARLAQSEHNPLTALMVLIDTLALETKNIQVGEGEDAVFISFFETAQQVVPELI